MERIDIKICQKIKKQAERVSKTISSSKKIEYYFFLFNIKMSEKALKFGGVDVMYLDPNK